MNAYGGTEGGFLLPINLDLDQEEREEGKGFRVFNMLDGLLGTPEDDWGMDVDWPDWIGWLSRLTY